MSQLKVKKPSKIDELKAMSPKDRNRAIGDLLMNNAMFIIIAIAIVGNILVYHLHLNTTACHEGDNLSMFYISPYYPTQLPLLGAVQAISYPLFVICYLLFFNGFSMLVWGVTKLIRKLRKEPA